MKTEKEILDKIEEYQEKLNYFIESYCSCGCQNDNIDYYTEQIKTLRWVLEVSKP